MSKQIEKTTESTPMEQKVSQSVMQKAIHQIQTKTFSLEELTKDASMGELIFFWGMVFSLFFAIFGGFLKRLCMFMISFGFRFIQVVLKESWVVVKTVIVATLLLILIMAFIYSTALITFIVKAK